MQAGFPGNCEKEEPREKDRLMHRTRGKRPANGNVRFVDVNMVLCYRKGVRVSTDIARARRKKKKEEEIRSRSGRSAERSGLT
jgi:hypothetical protein